MNKKKTIFLGTLLLSFSFTYAQVGINTTTPKATLDVNGNLKIRNTSPITTLNTNHVVLLKDKSTTGDNEIKEADISLFSSNVNSTVYSAQKDGSWSLLDLAIGNDWQKIGLTGASDTKVGNQALFTSGVYTAPQTGIYAVNYEFQFKSGVNLNVLGNKKLGLIKNNSIWEEKILDAVRVDVLGIGVVAVPVTSTNINTYVQLNAGETLTFAVNTTGLLPINISLLTDAKVSLQIHKISN